MTEACRSAMRDQSVASARLNRWWDNRSWYHGFIDAFYTTQERRTLTQAAQDADGRVIANCQ